VCTFPLPDVIPTAAGRWRDLQAPGKTPWQAGHEEEGVTAEPPALVARSLPAASLGDPARTRVEGRDGASCAALQRAWGLAPPGPSQSKAPWGWAQPSTSQTPHRQTWSREKTRLGLTCRGLDAIWGVMACYKN